MKLSNKKVSNKKVNKQYTCKNRKKHKYYIVRCFNRKYERNYVYLESYLRKLGVKPDTTAMDNIHHLDKKIFKDKDINISEYCLYENNINLQKIDKRLVNADVFFLCNFNNKINKRFFEYPKFLTNICNKEITEKILNKDAIIENLQKLDINISKYIPETFNIALLDKYNFPTWYILRPIDSFSGYGIKYVNSKKELDNAIKYYKITKNYKGILYGNKVIASEYVSNPLLFKTKKFHVRLYLAITLVNNVFNSFLLDIGHIITANLPFNTDIPFTTDVHDSHSRYTDNDYFFPNDFTKENMNLDITKQELHELWNKIRFISLNIAKILKVHKDKLLYPNEKNLIYMLGIDIMIRDNLDPVFIEINTNPGIITKLETTWDYFSKQYFKWINEIILEPLFKYNTPNTNISRKHKTCIL